MAFNNSDSFVNPSLHKLGPGIPGLQREILMAAWRKSFLQPDNL